MWVVVDQTSVPVYARHVHITSNNDPWERTIWLQFLQRLFKITKWINISSWWTIKGSYVQWFLIYYFDLDPYCLNLTVKLGLVGRNYCIMHRNKDSASRIYIYSVFSEYFITTGKYFSGFTSSTFALKRPLLCWLLMLLQFKFSTFNFCRYCDLFLLVEVCFETVVDLGFLRFAQSGSVEADCNVSHNKSLDRSTSRSLMQLWWKYLTMSLRNLVCHGSNISTCMMMYLQGSCRLGHQSSKSEYDTTDHIDRTAGLFDCILRVFFEPRKGTATWVLDLPQYLHRGSSCCRWRRGKPNVEELGEPDFKMATRLSRVMLRKVPDPTSNVASDDESL